MASEEIVTANDNERKMFVGGLPQDAKEKDLMEHFVQFGEVEAVHMKIDFATGRGRGFAFVIYKEVSAMEAAIAAPEHTVKGKKLVCKQAEVKEGKIYVGKLASSITNEKLKEYFGKYGAVVDVARPIDKTRDNAPKNFAFITFEKDDAARQLIKLGTVTIEGAEVEVKRILKDNNARGGGRGGTRGGMMGTGYGYGGYGDPYGICMYGGYGGGFGGYGSGGYNNGGYNSGGYNSGGYNSGGYSSGYNNGGYPDFRGNLNGGRGRGGRGRSSRPF